MTAHQQFKRICYAVSVQLGLEIVRFYDQKTTPNFQVCEVRYRQGQARIFILCSINGDWSLSERYKPNEARLVFCDDTKIANILKTDYGIRVRDQRTLLAPFSESDYPNDKDVQYWQPETVGEFLFNWWD